MTVELDAEYRLMREETALVERPVGVVSVSGAEAVDLLQGQLTNDVEGLGSGQGAYAALLDRKAHVMADCRVLKIDEGRLLLIAEPACAEALLSHLGTYKIGREVEVVDGSPEWSLLSLLGPGAKATLESAAGGRVSLGAELTHSWVAVAAAGIDCLATATPWGVDLLAPAPEEGAVRQALIDAGAVPASEDAAEILRVEAGRPRFGAEITPALMPAEAGIVERAVSFEKGCYLGQEPVARLHYKGRPNRVLRGLRLSAGAEPGDTLALDGRIVGEIATACVSPAKGAIALAVVRREAEPGAELDLGSGGTATVVELPFT